jgi:hypothetical protein
MNMKRGLVLTLCAAAVAAMAGPALAAVHVQLNLRYTDPSNLNGGGTWDLLAKTDTVGMNGIAGMQVTIGGNLGVTGVDLPANVITPNAAVFTPATSIFKYNLVGGKTQIVLGDDLAGTLVTGVGKGAGTPGNVVDDDLFPNMVSFWDNSARLASGTWTGAKPTLVQADVLVNEFNGSNVAVLGAAGTVVVRGDAVRSPDTAGTPGLVPGDANRDGKVDLSDFAILSGNYRKGPGETRGWDQGDFNGSTGGLNEVDLSDFAILSGHYNQTATGLASVPAVAAVPEPSSMIVGLVGALGMAALGRRK